MSKKTLIFCVTILLLSLVGTAFVYGKLPDTIATHFGFNDEADRFSPKWMIFVIGGVFPAGILALLGIAPKIDPRKESYKKHEKAYQLVCLLTILLLVLVTWIMIIKALGVNIPVGAVVMGATGVLFLVLGNFLPQVRPNYTFGIKVPWTLSDKNNWRATHRVGGLVFGCAGLLMVFAVFLPYPFGAVLYFCAVGAMILVPILFSYVYYRRSGKNRQQND